MQKASLGVVSLGLAVGIAWALGVFLLGLGAGLFDWGIPVVAVLASLYRGIGYPLRSRDVNMLGWRTRHPIPKAGSTTRAP